MILALFSTPRFTARVRCRTDGAYARRSGDQRARALREVRLIRSPRNRLNLRRADCRDCVLCVDAARHVYSHPNFPRLISGDARLSVRSRHVLSPLQSAISEKQPHYRSISSWHFNAMNDIRATLSLETCLPISELNTVDRFKRVGVIGAALFLSATLPGCALQGGSGQRPKPGTCRCHGECTGGAEAALGTEPTERAICLNP